MAKNFWKCWRGSIKEDCIWIIWSVCKSHKKLKATVFFDKTQLPLRDRLVQDEAEIDNMLSQLEEVLFGDDRNDAYWMEKPQYFIAPSPVGHILGMLWVLEIGEKLDKTPGKTGKPTVCCPIL